MDFAIISVKCWLNIDKNGKLMETMSQSRYFKTKVVLNAIRNFGEKKFLKLFKTAK